MENPTKAKMHSAIDKAKLDGKTPVVFIAFDEEGKSSDTSFFYGDQGQLVPLIYDVLGKVLFSPPQPMEMPPQIDLTRN
jgi:hypothetical protein